MSNELPERPRLAEHVLARHHTTPGRDVVVLIDTRDDSRYELELSDWDALSTADGTRDLDGIVLAAASRGSLRRVSALHSMLADLHEAGLLAAGTASPRAVFEEPPETPADRPVEALPDFSLTCDGEGTCCRTYGSVAFSVEEAERARVLARPDVPTSWLFTPHHGSRECEQLAVSLDAGACAFLDASARCRIHAAGGAHAKPLGCRHYPATFTDDGVTVRVSVGLECACVARSVLLVTPPIPPSGGDPPSEGAPLTDARHAGDLPPATRIQRLTRDITVCPGKKASREALSSWSRLLMTDLPIDAVDGFLRIATTSEHGELVGWCASSDVPTSARDASLDRARAITVSAARVLAASGDRSHVSTHAGLAWIAAAQPSPADVAPVATPDPVESLYLRSGLHGHQAVQPNVMTAFLLRAARVALARAMSRTPPSSSEPGRRWFAHPIVAVETLNRALGLRHAESG